MLIRISLLKRLGLISLTLFSSTLLLFVTMQPIQSIYIYIYIARKLF